LIRQLEVKGTTPIKYYMTKGDMFHTQEDRTKCMVQITQALAAHIRPTHGFEMPVIYLPEEAM